MKRKKFMPILMALSMIVSCIPSQANYYTAQEYADVESGIIFEDKGIVLENYPQLGYMTYRNLSNQVVKIPYYTSNLVVEKEGIEEIEDRVGYLDELFPYFEFDPKDTTIENIEPGDNIYIRTDKKGYVTYISAYNDYMLRYGKITSWDSTNGELVIEDEKGQIFFYDVDKDTHTTKLDRPVNLSTMRVGEWVKLLVSNRYLGNGIIDEKVAEIVIDGNTRTVQDIYKGNVLQLGSYDNTIKLAYAQPLEQEGWGKYTDILTLDANPKNFNAYLEGRKTSYDYASKYLSGSRINAFVAVEDFMGKNNVVKMNVSDAFQTVIKPTQVISVMSNEIRLLTGETLYYGPDTIVLNDDRLIDPHNIIVGDIIQTVVSGEDNIAVAKIVNDIGQGKLQVYRGLVKKIEDRQSFVVETFSLLQSDEWYYHAQPRTFSIDYSTRFYNDDGFVDNGIEDFLGYGENSQLSEIVTIVASGDKAVLVSDMPYTREVARGVVYKVEEGLTFLKDVFHYNVDDNIWTEYSTTNIGISVEINPNGFIIKNGELVTIDELEKGDTVSVMLEDELMDAVGDDAEGVAEVPSYMMIVK